MKRRLFTILPALSLMLCIATVTLWIRSYWAMDAISFTTYWGDGGFDRLEVLSESGYMHLYVLTPPGVYPIGKPAHARRVPPEYREYPEAPGQHWSFRYWTRSNVDSGLGDTYLGSRVRAWKLALAAAVLPAMWLTSRSSVWKRWRSGRKHGLCPACGYDLRASKDRCPECGTPIPAQTTSSGGKV